MTQSIERPALAMPETEGAIARLRRLTQRDIQAEWRQWRGDLPQDQATHPQFWQDWQPVCLNDRHHIAWDQGEAVIWLGVEIQIPSDLAGYPLAGLALRLSLTWWATAAQIFVDGQLVQEGDLFDHSARVLVREAVQPGEAIAITLRLVSPGHDPGALVRSLCLYERPGYGLDPVPDPGFVADELAVLQQYLSTLAPERCGDLEAAIAPCNWAIIPNQKTFDAEMARLRDRLLPFSDWIKQRQIFLLGHAHLDLAWLWPVAETWEVAERTFQSVLNLQAEFPELIFSHSSPVLYAWLETHRPALFEAIRQQVAAGRWEVAAGLWVEPEFNTVGGEAIARQILYGQRYVTERFGKPSAVAWLPDSFGFCWQLPQLLRQGGVRYFVTQKLRWNDTNPFELDWFWWQSPSSTTPEETGGILSLNSAPIGEGFDPLKMAQYATAWEAKTGFSEALWLIGVGDHGGGPSRDMLHLARRWGRSPFFPRLAFSSAEAFLERITPPAPSATPSATLPVWQDELYLEFHRGCYTTHADQKTWNRQGESSLYAAELWGTLAAHLTGFDYPAAALETAWKQVLFNQFHDILPGSAIPQVYEDANQEWAAAVATAEAACEAALGAIAQHIAHPEPPTPNARPLIVFNSLNWERSESVCLALSALPSGSWQIRDLHGQPVKTQIEADALRLMFQAERVPGVGYRLFWLCDEAAKPAADLAPNANPYILENATLRVTVDPATGNLLSLFDKRQSRDLLAAPANVLQAFRDSGQYWDAWNIDPQFERHPLPPSELVQIDPVQVQVIDQSLRVVRRVGQSAIAQRYVLRGDAPILWVETHVDWQECQTLLKVAFPVAVDSAEFWRDMPFGAIAHPTLPTDPRDQAKWEVPALRWVDLSEATHGLSLLTGIKHGVDVRPGQLRLSLLRSPLYPNPAADRGAHQFTYALAPHPGTWQTATTVRQSRELSQPLRVCLIPIASNADASNTDASNTDASNTDASNTDIANTDTSNPGTSSPDDSHTPPQRAALPPTQCLVALTAPNLILAALKPAEANPQQIIVRCYEAHGDRLEAPLAQVLSWLPDADPVPATITPLATPLLETLPLPTHKKTQGVITIHPWEICTFLITPA